MFPKKPLAALMLLTGAAGGPYLLFETDAGKQAKSIAETVFNVSTSRRENNAANQQSTWQVAADGTVIPNPAAVGVGNISELSSQPMANPQLSFAPGQLASHHALPTAHQLRDVLRFEISPQSVTSMFNRVSMVLADVNLDGMRVPLVTGTQSTDLAGTLTYYFDRYQRLQRLSLHGLTGDPNRLVSELQQLYDLRQEPALGGGLFLITWNGQPTSVMHIAPAAVINSSDQYARYTIFLELNLPSMPYGLSNEAANLVESGKATRRW